MKVDVQLSDHDYYVGFGLQFGFPVFEEVKGDEIWVAFGDHYDVEKVYSQKKRLYTLGYDEIEWLGRFNKEDGSLIKGYVISHVAHHPQEDDYSELYSWYYEQRQGYIQSRREEIEMDNARAGEDLEGSSVPAREEDSSNEGV